MKVLIYSGAYFSDNTLPLYKAMKAKGVDVTLLFELTGPNVNLFNEKQMIPRKGIIKATEYPSFRRYANYCDLSDVYVENLPGVRQRSIKMLKSTICVSNFIKVGNYDVIHTDITMMMWKAPLLKFHKKMVLIQHEAIPHARKQRLVERLFRRLNFFIIPKIVILNSTVYGQFCNKYGLKRENVLVNKLGPLDCIRIFVNNKKDYNPNKIVFWGRIAKYKGLEYLCQAMPMVHDKVPDAELIIAGGGDFYFDVEPYKHLPYVHIIHKYLDMEELANVISDCAFTVCPYISSSQSGSVITSLVMGKPVVGTNFDTMKEMIEDGVTGLLVPPKDVNSLAETLIRLLNDIDLQKFLMNSIKERIKPDAEWGKIADKYLAFYEKYV